MTEIPTWWLILSGAFFLLNTLLFIVLIVAVIKMIPMIQQMTTKVQDLTVKVESVATRVEEVAANVKTTTDDLGKKATGILGSVELVAQSASKQFERFSPYIVGAMTAIRLVKALNEMKHGRSALDATKKKTLEKKPATKEPKKLFGIF